ncbi:MAG: allantoinase AllB [Candidatus Muiribacteriaceae bacterium]
MKRLSNIRLPIDDRLRDGEIIFDSRIVSVSTGKLDISVSEEIDGNGMIALPGGIDPHVHFNTPGFTHHETFETGSRGAIKGGITTIIDMPCTSLPPVTDSDSLRNKLNAVSHSAWCDFGFHGGISGNVFDSGEDLFKKLTSLKESGVTAIKVYTVSGMDTFRDLDNHQIFRTMKICARLDLPVMVHAEDKSTVNNLTAALKAEGRIDYRAYCDSRPVEAELIAVNNVCFMAYLTGAKTHIVHMSSGEGVKVVRSWKEKGANVTCETCPHYLEFSDEDFAEFKGILKTAPVVKGKNVRLELWEHLASGNIHFMSTDHAPCDPITEKNTGNAWDDYGGIPGVEILYPYMLSEGLMKKKINLKRLLDIMCRNSARLFGLYGRKGDILPGFDADIILFDTESEFQVNSRDFESVGKYSPFDNMTFRGSIASVFLRGERIYYKGELSKRCGKYLKRNPI